MSPLSSGITLELLDALLSPAAASAGTATPSPRQQAEHYLDAMEVHDRVHGLLTILLQLCHVDSSSNTGRILLSCVLLRRNTAALGGIAYGQRGSATKAMTLLQQLTEPLTQLFAATTLPPNCRRQVGYCLAEQCCSLELVSSSEAVMRHVLTSIGPMCSCSDPIALSLLANLADRAPKTLCAFGADLPSLLQSALSAVLAQPAQNSSKSLEALTEAICYVATATQVVASNTTGSTGNMAMMMMMPDLQSSHNDIKVDGSSPASSIGSKCMIPLLQQLGSSVGVLNENTLRRMLEHLAQAASTCPSLLAGQHGTLQMVLGTCMTLASSTTLDDAVRLASLQVLASLCENNDFKRRVLAEPTQGVALRNALLEGEKSVIRICIQFCVSGVDEDVEEWTTDPASIVDDVPTWEGDDTATYAESLLCTFLQNLGGGQRSLPVVLPMVESLLSNSQWQNQRAALSVLEQCLYAAPVTFARHVPVAVESALHMAKNDKVRVQFQSMVLLGALCEAEEALDANIRAQHAGRLLEAMARLVSSRCTKVAAIACLAIVSYCRGGMGRSNEPGSGESCVVPFLKDVLLALVSGPLSLEIMNGSAVDGGAVAVKIRAVGAVACLAEAAGEAFVPFYSDVVPGLLGCAQIGSNQYDIARLRGAAIEAATIVGGAVAESNRDMYVSDAGTIMQITVPILQSDELGSNSIPMDQLLSACARIAGVMEQEYAPYIDIVLPHLLAKVSAPPDIQCSEGDESGLEATRRGDRQMDDDEGTESMTVALPGKGLTKVTINSTRMYEKALAAKAIYEHASALQESFGPYVETTMVALIPLIDFKYSNDVRGSVCKAIAATFDAACAYGEQDGMALAQKYMPVLADALSKQILEEDPADPETLFSVADSLSDVYYFSYRSLATSNRRVIADFTSKHAKDTVRRTMKSMLSCLVRRAKLYKSLEGADGPLSGEDEKEEYMVALSGEEEVLTPLVDCVGYTLKFLRESFLPIFESDVAPILGKFLQAGGSPDVRARYAAVCLFDDCVEHCGSRAASTFAPLLTEGAMIGLDDQKNDGDLDLKQVSLYGIAQLARYAPAGTLDPHAQTLLTVLGRLSQTAKDESDRPILIENAVSALASLTLFGKAPFAKIAQAKKSAILSTFLYQLPLREDESEAKICHAGLCDLVEQGQVSVAAELPRLLSIVGSIFACISDGEDLASPETQARLATLLVDMQHKVPSDRMQSAFATLDREAQDAINSAMHQFSQMGSGANLVSP